MAGTYKREQVVWVTYRKQQRWPAKVVMPKLVIMPKCDAKFRLNVFTLRR